MENTIAAMFMGVVIGILAGAMVFQQVHEVPVKEKACKALDSRLDDSQQFCIKGDRIILRF